MLLYAMEKISENQQIAKPYLGSKPENLLEAFKDQIGSKPLLAIEDAPKKTQNKESEESKENSEERNEIIEKFQFSWKDFPKSFNKKSLEAHILMILDNLFLAQKDTGKEDYPKQMQCLFLSAMTGKTMEYFLNLYPKKGSKTDISKELFEEAKKFIPDFNSSENNFFSKDLTMQEAQEKIDSLSLQLNEHNMVSVLEEFLDLFIKLAPRISYTNNYFREAFSSQKLLKALLSKHGLNLLIGPNTGGEPFAASRLYQFERQMVSLAGDQQYVFNDTVLKVLKILLDIFNNLPTSLANGGPLAGLLSQFKDFQDEMFSEFTPKDRNLEVIRSIFKAQRNNIEVAKVYEEFFSTLSQKTTEEMTTFILNTILDPTTLANPRLILQNVPTKKSEEAILKMIDDAFNRGQQTHKFNRDEVKDFILENINTLKEAADKLGSFSPNSAIVEALQRQFCLKGTVEETVRALTEYESSVDFIAGVEFYSKKEVSRALDKLSSLPNKDLAEKYSKIREFYNTFNEVRDERNAAKTQQSLIQSQKQKFEDREESKKEQSPKASSKELTQISPRELTKKI